MSADTARRNVRLLSWIGLATGLLGGVLVAFPTVIGLASPWVQLALGVATLVLAFRARKIGIAEVPDYDGRLSPVRPRSASWSPSRTDPGPGRWLASPKLVRWHPRQQTTT